MHHTRGEELLNIAKDKWKKPILEIINEADEPVGSWYIVNALNDMGIEVSSATVGRELNQLEVLGYVGETRIQRAQYH